MPRHALDDPPWACLRCRVTLADASRCPRCKHLPVDLRTAEGRAALAASERRARAGRATLVAALALLLGAGGAVAGGAVGLAKALGWGGVALALVAVGLGARPGALAPLSRLGGEPGAERRDGPDGRE